MPGWQSFSLSSSLRHSCTFSHLPSRCSLAAGTSQRILTWPRIAATLVAAGGKASNRCTGRAGWRPPRLRTTHHRLNTRPRTTTARRRRRRAVTSMARVMGIMADNREARTAETRRASSFSRRRTPTIAIQSTRRLRDLRRMPPNETSGEDARGALEVQEEFVFTWEVEKVA